MMNQPRRPRLPVIAPEPPPPHKPDPRFRPDERKEGGPDYSKESHQREKARRDGIDPVTEVDNRPPD